MVCHAPEPVFTERRKHDIQPCRLSLGTSAFGPMPLAAHDPLRTFENAGELLAEGSEMMVGLGEC